MASLARAAVLGVIVWAAGCFNPKLADQPFRCGDGSECPPDYRCDTATGFCTQSPGSTIDAGADATTTDVPVVPHPDAPGGTPDGPPGTPDAGSCVPDNLTCSGDNLTTCNGTVVRCPVGCAGSAGSASCLVLVPTGLTDGFCRAPAQAVVDVRADAVIDTTDCAGSGGAVIPVLGGPELCVFRVAELTLREQTTLRFSGSRVPVLLATGRLDIRGLIDVGAHGHEPGPGLAPDDVTFGDGADGALGAGTNKAGRGGGGGGHFTEGGVGGVVGDDISTPGGLAYGFPDLAPLEPGAFGGRGGQPCNFPPCPIASRGAGGGALQLVACQELRLGNNAAIDAGGGGGPGGRGGVILLQPPDGGSGGGSAGSILIEAPDVEIPSGALLGAVGGGGGGGGGISLDSNNPTGQPGQPGGDGLLPFAGLGGNAGSLGGGGGGGGGKGTGDLAPGFGGSAGAGAAGGGGGAAGRIRINVRPDRTVTFHQGSTVLPAPSTGSIVRQR